MDTDHTTEHEHEHDEQTPQEFDARMRSSLGLADDVSGERHPAVPPPHDDAPYFPRPAGVDASPAWDVSETARPAAYVAARADLVAKATRADELAAQLHALPGEQAQAAAAFEAEVQRADREGRAPKFARPQDWSGKRAALEARHKGRWQEYMRARELYAVAVRDTREEWLEALDAEREPARVAALQALRDAAAAIQALDRWTVTTVGAAALWSELHPRTPAPPLDLGAVRSVTEGTAAAVALLESDHEAVSGRWMSEGHEPPRHVRAQWAASGGGARQALLDVELAESFKITQHCLPDALANGLWGEVQTGPDGRRYLRA